MPEHNPFFRENFVNAHPEADLDSTQAPRIQEQQTFFQNTLDVVRERKLLAASAAAAFSIPYATGFANGLSPREALIYGTLDWITLGKHDLKTADNEVLNEVLNAYIELASETTIFGLVARGIYERYQRKRKRTQAIKEGHATLRPEGEQIIVLGGESSNVIDSLANSAYGSFVPVLESLQGASNLISLGSREIERGQGIYLNLDINPRTDFSYITSLAWDRLNLGPNNLIESANGKKYMLVVGCGESADEELSLDSADIDVTHTDLKNAVTQVKYLLKDHLEEGRDVIDVYIGNSGICHISPVDRQPVTDRTLAKKKGVDIYLDTWALTLNELSELLSAEDLGEGEKTKLTFATTNPEYLSSFNELFAPHLRRFQGRNNVEIINADHADEQTTWIVYEGASDKTFQTARFLRKNYPHKKIIGILSHDEVLRYSEPAGVEGVDFITASSILARTINEIRGYLKDGITPQEIQDRIDSKAPPVKLETNEICIAS